MRTDGVPYGVVRTTARRAQKSQSTRDRERACDRAVGLQCCGVFDDVDKALFNSIVWMFLGVWLPRCVMFG